MPEYRRPLGEKGMHAFLLAFGCERRLEQAPLMQHAFGQRRFERAIHGLLGQADGGQVVAGDGDRVSLDAVLGFACPKKGACARRGAVCVRRAGAGVASLNSRLRHLCGSLQQTVGDKVVE